MGHVLKRFGRSGQFLGYYLRYTDADGQRKQRASHQPTLALARRMLVEIEARVARNLTGVPEPTAPGSVPTVAMLVERFLREYSRPRIKDLGQYRAHARTALRRALPLVGTRRADTLEQTELARLRDVLAERCAQNSVRLTLAFLGVVYGWAVRTGILAKNPLRGLETPVRQDLVEYLSKEEAGALLALAERKALWGGLPERMRHACLCLALHGGLRKGELFGLRWQDLDLPTRRLTVARSYRSTPKGGRPRHLRLPSAAVPVLTAWQKLCPKTSEGLVFPVLAGARPRIGTPSDMLDLSALLVESGCRSLLRPWHALRHTFASRFVMEGGNLLTLQKFLGHSDIKMTLIYAHLAPDFLGEEIDRVRF